MVTRPEISATLANRVQFNTFGGNPLASAVGSAVLDVLEEDGCQQNSKDVGTYLLMELAKMRDEFEIIGDVRGKGLMIGIEMVKDKATHEPLGAEKMSEVWDGCKDLGVLLGKGGLHGNVFRIKPPMCITKRDVTFAIDVMRKVLRYASA